MKFSYYNLKMASMSGDRVGAWKGSPVFACSQDDLDNAGGGAYFIVYDDNNNIVRRHNDIWYKYGRVSEEGSVSELDCRVKYFTEIPYRDVKAEFHPVCGKTADKCDGTAAPVADDEVVGDVKMGLDVEATLKAAREMTIDLLLEGFNYGLDEAKG